MKYSFSRNPHMLLAFFTRQKANINGLRLRVYKVITSNPDPAIKRQILRELEFNRGCDSRYICKYYGAFFDETSSTISIAMEFCEGGSLDAIYKEVKKLGGRTGEKV